MTSLPPKNQGSVPQTQTYLQQVGIVLGHVHSTVQEVGGGRQAEAGGILCWDLNIQLSIAGVPEVDRHHDLRHALKGWRLQA